MTAKDSIVSALLSKAQSEINNIKKSHEFVKAVENEVNNIVKETNIETSYHNWLELNDKIYELETKILPELKAQRRILSEEIYLTLKTPLSNQMFLCFFIKLTMNRVYYLNNRFPIVVDSAIRLWIRVKIFVYSICRF